MEAAYKKMFGKLPSTHNAILGYQAIYLLAAALKQVGSTDAKGLASYLQSVKNATYTGSTILGFPANTASRTAVVVGFTKSGAFKQVEAPFPP